MKGGLGFHVIVFLLFSDSLSELIIGAKGYEEFFSWGVIWIAANGIYYLIQNQLFLLIDNFDKVYSVSLLLFFCLKLQHLLAITSASSIL